MYQSTDNIISFPSRTQKTDFVNDATATSNSLDSPVTRVAPVKSRTLDFRLRYYTSSVRQKGDVEYSRAFSECLSSLAEVAISSNSGGNEDNEMSTDYNALLLQKLSQDQSDLKRDLLAIEEKQTQSLIRIEERMDKRLDRIEDSISKGLSSIEDRTRTMEDRFDGKMKSLETKIDGNNKFIISISLSVIIGIAAMVVAVLIALMQIIPPAP